MKNTNKKIFRFDDVCINADMSLIKDMTHFLNERFDCRVIHAISPAVQKNCGQRVFRKILNAYSDFREFYKIDMVGIPEIVEGAERASHGLIHVDHRLLAKEAQEISILTSCSLTDSKIFIPPFNKWNKNTEEICKEFGIELVKFEDGWKCIEYNKFMPDHNLWYLHAREFTFEGFKQWFS